MSPLILGVDIAAPPTDLPAQLSEAVSGLGVELLVVPLAHPRYKRDHKRPRPEPMTRSDTQLSSDQWGRHIVGKLSPWLSLDSVHDAIRARSEAAFKQEIAWAAHLGLQAVLLPPPDADAANYARLLQWATLSTQHIQFLVRVPIGSAGDDAASGSAGECCGAWACWDRLRTLCEQSPSLGLALELGDELPERPAELERWLGEPVRMLTIPTSSFLTNKKGYPALPRRHQAAFGQLLRLRPKLVVSGRAGRGEDATPLSGGGGGGGAQAEGIGAYLQYVRHLISRRAPADELARFEAPYYDYLQAPLQPLQDNLESSTYETFEQDPVKSVDSMAHIVPQRGLLTASGTFPTGTSSTRPRWPRRCASATRRRRAPPRRRW